MAPKQKEEEIIDMEDVDENDDEQEEGEAVPSGSDDDDDGKSDSGDEKVEVVKDDEKDERIAVRKNKDYSQETLEEKRARRRDEKRKKRHQEYLNRVNLREKEKENLELKKRLEALEKMAPQFAQRVEAQEELQLDNAINSQANLYRQAEIALEKAITEGNGTLAREAQRVLLDANNKYTQLVALKQRPKETETRQAADSEQQKKPQASEATKFHGMRWAAKNSWYSPQGDDEESRLARVVDRKLISEGYDPDTEEFWDELTERMREEAPYLFEEKKKPQQLSSSSPRPKQVHGSMGADSASSGAKTLKIPERVVKMAKDAGIWDDPKQQKLFIKNWKLQQQENRD